MPIRVRAFLPEDREWIVGLIKRLSEFEMPEWRRAGNIDQTNMSLIKTAMDETEPGTAIFVAIDETKNEVIGFVRLQTQTDYFSGEKVGYISNLAVARAFEGQGVGRLLMERSEAWARENGFDQLTLHVFVNNERALQVYEKNGYQKEILKYVKVLSSV